MSEWVFSSLLKDTLWLNFQVCANMVAEKAQLVNYLQKKNLKHMTQNRSELQMSSGHK